MMQFFRKNVRSIMLVVVVLFVVSCFAGYGMYSGGRRPSDGSRDYAVANVSGRRIMRSELETATGQLLQSMGIASNISSRDYPAIRRNVLEQMGIEAELEKEIASRGIKVIPASVDEALSGIEASFPTKEIFMQQLQQAGLDENALKENLGEQIKQQMLFGQLLAGVSIDQTEIRSYYDTMAAVESPTLTRPAGFNMNLANFNSMEAAQKAYDEVNGGQNWDDVMKAVGSADIQEFVPYDAPIFIPTAQLTDKAEFLRTLPMNTLAQPVEITTGVYLVAIKRSEQKEGTASFDEISADIEMMLRGQKGQQLQTDFIQEIRTRASIEILDEELFRTPEPETSGDVTATSGDVVEEAVSADQ